MPKVFQAGVIEWKEKGTKPDLIVVERGDEIEAWGDYRADKVVTGWDSGEFQDINDAISWAFAGRYESDISQMSDRQIVELVAGMRKGKISDGYTVRPKRKRIYREKK
jgi:hypothetical protein